ncbi:MAG TPA: class I SAM-dependent methyltransferase [Wenzhouxiangellaceae bacterium]|nr:class I SAM-dependent methyltransferase [Wenzhouxiangellaceae bacterium]
MSERFEFDWLALREPVDAAARDRTLATRARDWLANRPTPLRITDLGAGSGANTSFLAGYLSGPQHWRLVDHDPELLKRAASRVVDVRDAEGASIRFQTCRQDLADIDTAIADGTDLATASALLDLVSADWMNRLAARCATVGCATLWTMTVDGDWHFTGPDGNRIQDGEDAAMLSLYQAHQAHDKGLGRALGGAAPKSLRAAFARHGFNIAEAPSPWRLLPGKQRPLALTLLDGWCNALVEQVPAEERKIEAWWRNRRAGVEAGRLGIEVGHIDLYAEPPP